MKQMKTKNPNFNSRIDNKVSPITVCYMWVSLYSKGIFKDLHQDEQAINPLYITRPILQNGEIKFKDPVIN